MAGRLCQRSASILSPTRLQEASKRRCLARTRPELISCEPAAAPQHRTPFMDNPDLGSLPQWNLGDLYASPTAPGIEGDLAKAEAEAKDLARRYQGKLATLGGDEMAEAVKSYEALQDVLGRVGSYAQLVYAGNMSDPENGRFYQTIQERITDITAAVIFFTLEINRIDERALQEKLKTPELARYAPWFE